MVKPDEEGEADQTESILLRQLCRKELLAIYKHCFSNELVGPKPHSAYNAKQLDTVKKTWISFGRESFASMQRFARCFGLQDILLVSKAQKLNALWKEVISDNFKRQVEAAAAINDPTAMPASEKIGYLLDYQQFLIFLKRVSVDMYSEEAILGVL